MATQEDLAPVILIVEDHPPTLALVQQHLSSALPDCRVVAAATAEAALEVCAGRVPPRVVVMDVALPGIDGIEATRRVKALCPATQVVMHSSHDLPIYRDASAGAGAGAFVAKARSADELVPTIISLLSDWQPASPTLC